jgi:energy-coupling factor transport system substrate-specific component
MMGAKKLGAREIATFSTLGALMFVSKLALQWAPNIHLLGMMIVASTLAYRAKALFPVYIYVLLDGLYSGFAAWWLPYLYIWAILWALAMLVPRKAPRKAQIALCMALSCLHGLLFGTLYAPFQALMFGLSLKGMLAWIAAGFYFDLIHGISNLCAAILAVPMAELLKKINAGSGGQV